MKKIILTHEEVYCGLEEFYKNVGLSPEVIANAVLYAISQPDNVDVSDLAIRPAKES